MRKKKENFPLLKNHEFLLSAQELENPQIVFSNLFDAYDLADLRQRLRDVVESALFDNDCDSQSYFFLFKHLEKLVEAAHIIAERTEKLPEDSADEKADTAEQADEKFYKPPRFEEIASLRPMEALDKTFSMYSVNDLIEEIDKWKRCVMTGAIYMYYEISLREQFWTFCDQLMCLVESAHIYCLEQQPSEKKEMESFYTHFTLTYAQRELWDCFEAVSSDQREETCIDKNRIILTYRCLLTIIIATYYLLEGLEPANEVMMFEKEAV